MLARTEVDHWLTFCQGALVAEFKESIDYLESVVEPDSFLVGGTASAADYVLYGSLWCSGQWQGLVQSGGGGSCGRLVAWYKFVGRLPEVKGVVENLPKDLTPKAVALSAASNNKRSKGPAAAKPGDTKKVKDEGKFVELPDAEVGKVIVRFPPEASG